MKKTALLGKVLIDGTGGEPLHNPLILIIDAHVHLTFSSGPDHEAVRKSLNEDDRRGRLPYRALRNAQQALLGGITTLRDSGDKGLITLALRDAIKDGMVTGPRLYVSGMPITITDGHLHYCGLIANTDDEIKEAVAMLCDKGVDWIKVMATGGRMTAESRPVANQYTEQQLRIIVCEAHRRGKKVEAHVLNTASIKACVQAGIDQIAHCVWHDSRGEVQYVEEIVEGLIDKDIIVEMTQGIYVVFSHEPRTQLSNARSSWKNCKSFGRQCARCGMQASRSWCTVMRVFV